MSVDLNDEAVQKAVQEAAKKAAEELIKEQHAGLITKRDELLAMNRELKDKLTSFEGIDPQKVKDQMAAAERAEEERMKKDGEFDALMKKQSEKFEQERAASAAEQEKLRNALNQAKITEAATKAVAAHKGVPELLMPHIAPRMKLDDNLNLQILDRDGTPMLDSAGKPANADDLVAELKKDPLYGRAFEGTSARGTGATGSNGTMPDLGDNPFTKDEKTGKMKNLTEAMRITKQDPAKAAKMANEAGVKVKGLND